MCRNIENPINYGVLKLAQAISDWQSLLDVGRRVIRFHLESDVAAALGMLVNAL